MGLGQAINSMASRSYNTPIQHAISLNYFTPIIFINIPNAREGPGRLLIMAGVFKDLDLQFLI